MKVNDYQTLFLSGPFSFKLNNHPRERVLSDADCFAIETIWEKERVRCQGALFNGQALSMVSYDHQELTAEFVEYKYCLASIREPRLRKVLEVSPLAVSCVTSCRDSLLIGRRDQSVAQYPMWYELVPSGGIGKQAIAGNSFDPIKQALYELEEEAKIRSTDVTQARTFGIVRDNHTGMYEICLEIFLSDRVKEVRTEKSQEYQTLSWIQKKELGNFLDLHNKRIVPFSIYLLELLNLI